MERVEKVTSETEPPHWPPFRIHMEYNDAELAAYQQVATAARWQFMRPNWFWIAVAADIGVGFLGGLITIATHAATPHASGLIVVMLCIAFWLGLYMLRILASGRRRHLYDSFRARWQGGIVLVTPRGLTIRLENARVAYRRAAITAMTLQSGLILIWTSDYSQIAIPARLLTEEQRARLMSLHA